MGYWKWKSFLHPLIELVPVELAGRGSRSQCGLYQSFDDAIADLYEIVERQLTDESFYIFGHSMGSLLAYELGQTLMENGCPVPMGMFFSGREAPQVKKDKAYHLLNDEDFKDRIINIGGTPEDVFANKELNDLFVPILRADFKIHEGYIYQEKKQLCCDINVISGTNDLCINPDDLEGWRYLTEQRCTFHMLEGGHMFIYDNVHAVTNIINHSIIPSY
ncbi:Linear gramicidin dehydrogenase LgrE [compost metagenome]